MAFGAASVRPGAQRYLMKKSPSSFKYYRSWLWAIAGRKELELELELERSTHAGQEEMSKG